MMCASSHFNSQMLPARSKAWTHRSRGWKKALDQGFWFDGSSVEGFARIQESDMRLVPDMDTYAVLPWSPENLRRARLFCDIYNPDGTPFAGDPRGAPAPGAC